MNANLAPYPYDAAVLDVLHGDDTTFFDLNYSSTLGAFWSDTHRDGLAVSLILRGIANSPDDWNDIGQIVRVEFIYERNANGCEVKRGAVFFDSAGRAVLHAAHALLGYSGSGPSMSAQLLGVLGVSSQMFDEMNQAVPDCDYVVVVSRQTHMVVEGVDAAIPHAPSVDHWEWWRVR